MRHFIMIAFLTAAFGAAVSFKAHAEEAGGDVTSPRSVTICAPYAQLSAQIIRYGGRPVWRGLTKTGEASIEIWQSGSGSWLEVGRLSNGFGCIMGGGEGGELVPQDVPS